MKLPVMIDSGAFGLWRRYMKGHVGTDSSRRRSLVREFMRSDLFRKHRDGYYEFLRKHGRRVRAAVTLDIVGDGEASFALWEEMRADGFDVLPVFHYGEDFSWLRKYLDAGCDYIGIGGIAGRFMSGHVTHMERFVRSVFSYVPKGVKLHGFGVAVSRLVGRHPWHSFDSSTPARSRMYPYLLVPWGVRERAEDYVGGTRMYVGAGRSRKYDSLSYRLHEVSYSPSARGRVRAWAETRAGKSCIDLFATDFDALTAFNYYYVGEMERLLIEQTEHKTIVYCVESEARRKETVGVLKWEKGRKFPTFLHRADYARWCANNKRAPSYLIAYNTTSRRALERVLAAVEEVGAQRRRRLRR